MVEESSENKWENLQDGVKKKKKKSHPQMAKDTIFVHPIEGKKEEKKKGNEGEDGPHKTPQSWTPSLTALVRINASCHTHTRTLSQGKHVRERTAVGKNTTRIHQHTRSPCML